MLNKCSLYYAQLSAPTIYEAHCQTALTASAETLASSAQHLATTWKPLVEDPSRHQIGEQLSQCNLELIKSLDRLKAAFANLGKSGYFFISFEPVSFVNWWRSDSLPSLWTVLRVNGLYLQLYPREENLSLTDSHCPAIFTRW